MKMTMRSKVIFVLAVLAAGDGVYALRGARALDVVLLILGMFVVGLLSGAKGAAWVLQTRR